MSPNETVSFDGSQGINVLGQTTADGRIERRVASNKFSETSIVSRELAHFTTIGSGDHDVARRVALDVAASTETSLNAAHPEALLLSAPVGEHVLMGLFAADVVDLVHFKSVHDPADGSFVAVKVDLVDVEAGIGDVRDGEGKGEGTVVTVQEAEFRVASVRGVDLAVGNPEAEVKAEI